MCDQTQGLPAQQISPDSPVPFPSRETTAFPHFARMQSKRLRKLAGEGRNQAPPPQGGGCRTLSSPTGRRTSRSSQRLLQDVLQIVVQGHLLADQAFDGKQLDNLVLVPHGKLATVRLHLEEDAPSSHLRTEGVGGQIDIDAAIPTLCWLLSISVLKRALMLAL